MTDELRRHARVLEERLEIREERWIDQLEAQDRRLDALTAALHEISNAVRGLGAALTGFVKETAHGQSAPPTDGMSFLGMKPAAPRPNGHKTPPKPKRR
jgi:hypothetical protein